MARTLHQAMAYLGLAENEPERSSQPSRTLEPVYEETVFEADEAYEPFEQEETYQSAQAHISSPEDRDVLLGLQPDAHRAQTVSSRSATMHREPAGSSVNEQRSAAFASEASSLAADTFLEQGQGSATPTAQPAPRFTSDESDEELRRITTIHPRSYNDAKIIGESFRENIPVIMNVTDMGDTDAKRLVDFSAGLAFALHGSIERVTDKVFLLTPANLEVLGAEGAEVPVALDSDDSGLFNQG